MSRWFWIKFEKAIGHVVEERFVAAVKADLAARDCGPLEKFEECNRWYMDPGGSCIIGAPKETLPDLDGLALEADSAGVGLFRGRAEGLQERAGGYVKLHGFHSCLCMTPEQRDRLVMELRTLEDPAYDRYTVFLEDWKSGVGKRSAQ